METSILGPTTRIIWHDPNVNNNENVSYFQKFFSQTEIERFSNYEKVVDFLYEAPGSWIVITSGSKGRYLLPLIHDSRKVLGIVIFCSTKEFHEGWARDYAKVMKVVITIDEVVPEVQKLFKRFLLQGVLQVAGEEQKQNELNVIRKVLNQDSQKEDDSTVEIQEKVFHHFRKEDQVKFEFIAKLLLEDNYHNYPDEILNELKRLNPKDGEHIERLFLERKTEDLLGAILYLYSTGYIYKRMNEKFGVHAYDELAFTLSACVHEVMERPDLKVDPTKKLYRGLHRRSHEENYIENGETIYWPAFTSTSLDIEEAKSFARDDGIIFEIILSQANPHPNVILKEDWSEFPTEKEVLLFPHFAMKVKRKEVYGARILICVEQDESNGFLSLNNSELSEKWKEFVHKSVKPNYEASFELIRSKILQYFQLSNGVSMLMGDEGLDSFLRCQAFKKQPDQFKETLIGIMVQKFIKDLESKSFGWMGELLNICHLCKEISSRLCSSYCQFLTTKLAFVFEGIADRFIQLTQETSDQENLSTIVITKTLEDKSIDWSKLDEEIKTYVTQKLDSIQPELIKRAENYWEMENKCRA